MVSAVFYRFRLFAHEHDDIPAFHAAYLVGTFLTAAVLNLGFFELLIAAHMCLDFFKYREVHGFTLGQTFHAMILESITDIALFLMALTFSVYLSHTFLLAAVSGMVRSELSILKAIGTLLPKVHILEHTLEILFGIHTYLHSVHSSIRGGMTRLQKASALLAIICVSFLVAAVFVFRGHEDTLVQVLLRELVPHL